MPTYEFRCPAGDSADAHFSMAAVPRAIDCPTCGQPAVRRPSSPHMSRSSSSAYRLVESTERSAHEPAVVSALPGSGRPAPAYTHNPLHHKLPRP